MKDTNKKINLIWLAGTLLFWCSLFLLYYNTVLSRPLYKVHNARWKLFWSYPLIWNGNKFMYEEVLYNLLMLCPSGFFFCMMCYLSPFKKRGKTLFTTSKAIRNGLITGFLGFLFSGFIEFSQLVFKRGLFEWDDIWHNTISCLLGYEIFLICYKKHKHQKINVKDLVCLVPFILNLLVLLICRIYAVYF